MKCHIRFQGKNNYYTVGNCIKNNCIIHVQCTCNKKFRLLILNNYNYYHVILHTSILFCVVVTVTMVTMVRSPIGCTPVSSLTLLSPGGLTLLVLPSLSSGKWSCDGWLLWKPEVLTAAEALLSVSCSEVAMITLPGADVGMWVWSGGVSINAVCC